MKFAPLAWLPANQLNLDTRCARAQKMQGIYVNADKPPVVGFEYLARMGGRPGGRGTAVRVGAAVGGARPPRRRCHRARSRRAETRYVVAARQVGPISSRTPSGSAFPDDEDGRRRDFQQLGLSTYKTTISKFLADAVNYIPLFRWVVPNDMGAPDPEFVTRPPFDDPNLESSVLVSLPGENVSHSPVSQPIHPAAARTEVQPGPASKVRLRAAVIV